MLLPLARPLQHSSRHSAVHTHVAAKRRRCKESILYLLTDNVLGLSNAFKFDSKVLGVTVRKLCMRR